MYFLASLVSRLAAVPSRLAVICFVFWELHEPGGEDVYFWPSQSGTFWILGWYCVLINCYIALGLAFSESIERWWCWTIREQATKGGYFLLITRSSICFFYESVERWYSASREQFTNWLLFAYYSRYIYIFYMKGSRSRAEKKCEKVPTNLYFHIG